MPNYRSISIELYGKCFRRPKNALFWPISFCSYYSKFCNNRQPCYYCFYFFVIFLNLFAKPNIAGLDAAKIQVWIFLEGNLATSLRHCNRSKVKPAKGLIFRFHSAFFPSFPPSLLPSFLPSLLPSFPPSLLPSVSLSHCSFITAVMFLANQ